VEALLGTYDRERRVLPMPVARWSWGWTQSAETWNGRIAMLAIVVVLILEVRQGSSHDAHTCVGCGRAL
jgi:protoporphyrin/coproporphyrin ferrochelatase